MKKMKRNAYKVITYDNTVEKWYKNYKSAYNYCKKLIEIEKWCGIYIWDDVKNRMKLIIGC